MIALFIPCAGMGEASAFAYPYGVFLGITDNLAQFGDYEIVVIDAQYFSGEEIERFRNEGHQVYTYLNIGSLEDFRDYYEEYKDLSLGEYEHWEEEVWVDVSSRKWQDLILQELVPGLLEKQVDGFFVDNCDVYYEYPEQKILDGLGVIMQELVATGKEVIINSGDCFMDAWCEQGGMWDQVITGINQESVFSSILWDENAFGRQEEEDHEYFVTYLPAGIHPRRGAGQGDRPVLQGAWLHLLRIAYPGTGRLIPEKGKNVNRPRPKLVPAAVCCHFISGNSTLAHE